MYYEVIKASSEMSPSTQLCQMPAVYEIGEVDQNGFGSVLNLS